MKIQPLEDRVLIKPMEEKEKKLGSIIVPETAKEKPQIGAIEAVGTDEELQKNVKVGDKVIFAKYGGTEFELEGTVYLIVQKSDLLGVLKN
ncbi:MAG: co-chaperone GroES [Deltaproteobacteria bacterium]|nr:co-chaperone GroES [Deltaproteobacteria bacterium]MCL5277020.1 co-chaperone GroES [Deltaproteobacteria bacterium]